LKKNRSVPKKVEDVRKDGNQQMKVIGQIIFDVYENQSVMMKFSQSLKPEFVRSQLMNMTFQMTDQIVFNKIKEEKKRIQLFPSMSNLKVQS